MFELLHQLRDPEFLIQAGGLLLLMAIVFAETGLMVGFFLPGDSLLFTAGLLAATGVFPINLGYLLGGLTLAAVVGDQVGYWIGKGIGPRLFAREESRFFKPRYIAQTRAFYDRHGARTIMLGRFVPIVRTFAPVIAGVSAFPYRTFVLYNIVGGVVWVLGMTLLGYLLGSLFPALKRYIEYIAMGIILVSLIPVVSTAYKERQRAKAAANALKQSGHDH